MLLTDAIELFLSEFRPSTRKSYLYVLMDMQAYLGPARPLGDIRSQHLLEYARHYRGKTTAAGEPITPATVQKYSKTVKTFWNWAVRVELIEKSPAAVLRVAKLRSAIGREKAISEEELARLLDFVKWKPRDYALILFLADTGCRAGGAAGLRIDDLDLDNFRATVTEKGDKTRPVVFGDVCATAIRAWLLKRPRGAGIYVFSRTAGPMTANYLSLIIRRNCQAAGVRVVSAHAFRHRKGHQLADARVAPSIAATALGHSDPNITLRHYYPADWESAERELRRLATGTTPKNVIDMNKKPG